MWYMPSLYTKSHLDDPSFCIAGTESLPHAPVYTMGNLTAPGCLTYTFSSMEKNIVSLNNDFLSLESYAYFPLLKWHWKWCRNRVYLIKVIYPMAIVLIMHPKSNQNVINATCGPLLTSSTVLCVSIFSQGDSSLGFHYP